jgi:hypothetical protein
MEHITTMPNFKRKEDLLEGGAKLETTKPNESKDIVKSKYSDTKDTKDAKDTKDTKDTKDIKVSKDIKDAQDVHINLQVNQIYDIDYILLDDKDLINVDKVNKIVKQYIDNFNSDAIVKYKQAFQNIYQKYSNKRYIIHNIGNVLTVMKNELPKNKLKNQGKDKAKQEQESKSINKQAIIELKKPKYYYYNSNGNLAVLKRNISNERAVLQFLYQSLVNKLEVDIDAKKDFEKQRQKFIELLEQYYIYTLYHKLINKISSTNKINIIIQDIVSFIKDIDEKNNFNKDKDNKNNKSYVLEGNIYSIDNTVIDLINKHNTTKLNEYNDLISRMQSIKTIKDDKIVENIKEYLNKNDANMLDTIKSTVKLQNEYIDYIIKELP